ncbi:MAG: AsnC family transcriptional regulator [Aeromicrobium sp.]
MTDSHSDAELDETDRRLVHALQIQPRAPWRLVGDVIGLDPVTAARRWERLEQAGLAWVHALARTGRGVGSVSAWVEIRVDGDDIGTLADRLAQDDMVLSLRRMAGRRDLLALLAEADLPQLSMYVGDTLKQVAGVRDTRTHVITDAPILGMDWRLDALDPTEVAALEAPAASGTAPERALDEVDWRIVRVLDRDGRAPVTQIAAQSEVSVNTVTRRLRSLMAGDQLHLHCDVTRQASGYPVSAVYFASVPAEHLAETTRALRTLPAVRVCSVVAGPANLIVDVWLRSIHDVHSLEVYVSERLSHFSWRVLDRSVSLRTYKHHGRLLDAAGRAVGPANP